MIRIGFAALILTTVVCCLRLSAQNESVQGPTDLKMELRSATVSNRFQLGELIPLEVLVSSNAPNRYLEPCELFWEGCFGYPQCRFMTRWSFDVIPSTGWTDIGSHGCFEMSGPTFKVKSSDLTMEPKKYAYTLNKRFRFDAPGKYTVRLSLTVGLDDETNQIGTQESLTVKRHFVSKTAEMVVEIVPAGDAWTKTVVEQGITAYTAAPLPYTNPPSPELAKNQQERDAFCNMGTPEAAVAFAKLLSKGVDTRHCIEINANKDAMVAEMRRLLVDPDVGVHTIFFGEYAKLLSARDGTSGPEAAVTPKVINEVRDTLFASLSKKTSGAMIVSLETTLRNPMSGYWVVAGSPYDSRLPFSSEIIAIAVANYDRLSEETKKALLDREWDHVRSSQMLPVVRREAEEGNGHALLDWQELDPTAATAFMRVEVVRPVPRFSALYLRLPAPLLASEEQQLAANFVALGQPQELIDDATLLHRYGTRASLPAVLPFVNQHLAEWSCDVQIPVLAYLLKISPDTARVSLEQVLKTVRPPYCPRGEFFSSLGYLQADPVLDALASRQVEEDTAAADDAAIYLGKYGSAGMKPFVWEQLAHWHKKFVESGAEQRLTKGSLQKEDYPLYSLDSRLREAFIHAHGWLLSPEDVSKMSTLFGEKTAEGIACTFSCGSEVAVGPAPGNYLVYGRVSDLVYPPMDRVDYLMPMEPYQYQINQYGCQTLESLEEKILEFPAGSKFSFAHTGSGTDVGDWATISAFLRSHGYVAGN